MRTDTDLILGGLIQHQREKVLKIAQRISPGVTLEDIRNPQDLPKLYADPDFNFEDGILSGLLTAQMALRQSGDGGKGV
ncbi:MAG: hypothetical protein A3F16_06455 [Deltaproteobacteria bacterium RIFCSPHIGHO2_12_FULL_43_9]|nr:MAG: hypothetical protein A3F16_06455 [Deltaproteobacteria bacterium RIFCSPHIGHO2_12_FULL_43_9]